MKNRQCVLLVGGLGSRLGEITKTKPKPLLDIKGKPFLDYLISYISSFSVKEILLLSGYLKKQVQERYAGKMINNVPLKVIDEEELLGTAGALKNASSYLDEEFYLFNGDTFFGIDFLTLEEDIFSEDWIVVMGLRKTDSTKKFGLVNLDKKGVVSSFLEKNDTFQGDKIVNGGVYLIKKKILNYIPPGPCSLENTVFPGLVEKKALYGKLYNNYFIDIGYKETLDFIRKKGLPF